jgi:hypothetical protein
MEKEVKRTRKYKLENQNINKLELHKKFQIPKIDSDLSFQIET